MNILDLFPKEPFWGIPAQKDVNYVLNHAFDELTGCGGWGEGAACEIGRASIWGGLHSSGFALMVATTGGLIATVWTVRVAKKLISIGINAATTKWRESRNDHYFARFLEPYEAYRAGMFRAKGFRLGDKAWGMKRPLYCEGDASIMTFGGAGAGKGAGIVIPNCLTHEFQVIVDWGAEIVAVCLKHWFEKGYKVIVVNPTGRFCGQPYHLPQHKFNPLAPLDASAPGFGSMCRALAEALFLRTGHEHEPFFIDAGVAMVDFVTRLVKQLKGKDATLIDVYRAILGGLVEQKKFFKLMADCGDPLIVDAGNRLLQLQENGQRTLAAIVQQIDSKLAWMADDRFVDSLSGNDLDFDDLRGKNGHKGCIVVFVLPIDLMATHGAWIKLALNSFITEMVREHPQDRVLMRVDEAAILQNWFWIYQGPALLRRFRNSKSLCLSEHGPGVRNLRG